MRLLVYSLLRLLLFAAALAGLYALGLRSWLLVVVAAFVAAATSYLILQGPRTAAVAQVAGTVEARRARPRTDVDAAVEDAWDDATRAADPPSQGQGEPQEDAVGQLDQPGPLEDRDEVEPGGPPEHGPGSAGGRQG